MGPGIIRAHIKPARPDADEFTTTFIPKSPNEPQRDYFTRYILDPYFVVIPSYVKNPEDVLRVYADLSYVLENNVTEEQKEISLKAALDSNYISERDKEWQRKYLLDVQNGRFPIVYQPIGAFGNMDVDTQNLIFNKVVTLQTGVAAAVDAISLQYITLMKESQKKK